MGTVTTTKGETFSGNDSCNLAWMIYRRFGRDVTAAAVAWRRLLQNNCSDYDFAELVRQAPLNNEQARSPKPLAHFQLSLIRKISVVLARDRPTTVVEFFDADKDFEILPVGPIGGEMVGLVARTKAAQPATYVELLADDYAPFVERILKYEPLGPKDYPIFVAPESDQEPAAAPAEVRVGQIWATGEGTWAGHGLWRISSRTEANNGWNMCTEHGVEEVGSLRDVDFDGVKVTFVRETVKG